MLVPSASRTRRVVCGISALAVLLTRPAPLVGMQGWYDTVCSIRKVPV